ncbi:MAG: hypothetical protein WBQ50_19530 [Nocardioides sp.]
MSVTVKLLGFLAALTVVFASAVGIGRAVGPVELSAAGHGDMDEVTQDEVDGTDGVAGMEDMDMPGTSDIPKGLMVSQDGFTFRLESTKTSPGRGVPVSFTIEGPDGEPVTAYDVEHEQDLHLIAVRRDFTGFQHVHPEMDPDGTWSTDLDLTPGAWRLFADFKATGAEALTLGNDFAVPGRFDPAEASTADSTTATVDDYTVTLEGDLEAGAEAELTLTVTRDGESVTDLEPYLGAYGHLVALRAGDLAYLHVHPEGSPDDGKTQPGPEVVFFAQVPSPDRYHLFLDFRHEGVVRTAAFTLEGSADTIAAEDDSDEQSTGGHDDDDAH